MTSSWDGTEALGRLAGTRYDVVVLDRDLPGVHGDDVCRSIVADESGASCADADSLEHLVRDRVGGLGLGADDYLAKPFDFSGVARVRALGRRSTPAVPPTLVRRATSPSTRPGGWPSETAAGSISARRSSPSSPPARGFRPGRVRRGAARAGVGRDGRPVHDRCEDDGAPAPGEARRSAAGRHSPLGRLPDWSAPMIGRFLERHHLRRVSLRCPADGALHGADRGLRDRGALGPPVC